MNVRAYAMGLLPLIDMHDSAAAYLRRRSQQPEDLQDNPRAYGNSDNVRATEMAPFVERLARLVTKEVFDNQVRDKGDVFEPITWAEMEDAVENGLDALKKDVAACEAACTTVPKPSSVQLCPLTPEPWAAY